MSADYRAKNKSTLPCEKHEGYISQKRKIVIEETVLDLLLLHSFAFAYTSKYSFKIRNKPDYKAYSHCISVHSHSSGVRVASRFSSQNLTAMSEDEMNIDDGAYAHPFIFV